MNLNRKNDSSNIRVILLSVFFLIFLLLNICILIELIVAKEEMEIEYNEVNSTKYNVLLKKNGFYEDSLLDESNQYISELIKNININFKYDIDVNNNQLEDMFQYEVVALLEIKEKNDSIKTLYRKEFSLVPKSEFIGVSDNNIEENVVIDYEYFNNIVSKINRKYNLDKTYNSLTVMLNVRHVNNIKSGDVSKVDVIIPLNSKTVNIDVVDTLAKKDCKEKISKTNKKNVWELSVALCLFLVIDIVIFLRIIILVTNYNSKDKRYKRQIARLFSEYGSYIQEISEIIAIKKRNIYLSNKKVYEDCHIYTINDFRDLVEISSNVNSTVLMGHNKVNDVTYFIVLDLPNKSVFVNIITKDVGEMV